MAAMSAASESQAGPRTSRSALRRHAERGRYDRNTVEAILDEALMAHVGVTGPTGPVVLPMVYGRLGDCLYLHGAAGNALLRAGSGTEVCVTVTLLDGLVMARSWFHHSMNFRSVVILGRTRVVEDSEEKVRALAAVIDHMATDRSAQARPPTESELRSTLVLALELSETSAKIRTGPPIDDEADLDHPVWAGVIPLAVRAGTAEPDGSSDLPTPDHPGSSTGPQGAGGVAA
jgi:nitroimidazol reductase NimA-like FMN-containing flavoprotein (pyridoxamine 5'-phosphate oxidase superfamily)